MGWKEVGGIGKSRVAGGRLKRPIEDDHRTSVDQTWAAALPLAFG